MIITKELKLGIIDFDKNTVADPYDDSKPYVWTVDKSKAFEIGLIDSFYNFSVPKRFF